MSYGAPAVAELRSPAIALADDAIAPREGMALLERRGYSYDDVERRAIAQQRKLHILADPGRPIVLRRCAATAGLTWRTSGASVGTEPRVFKSGIWPAAGCDAVSVSTSKASESKRTAYVFMTCRIA